MLKKPCYHFLTILFILFLFCSQVTISKYSLNINSLTKNIEYLSSDSFKGRLAGTLENEAVANYIKDCFSQNKVEPYNGSYFQSFQSKYPFKLPDHPYLKIMDSSNKVVKEFSYGKDYKEDLLNFKANSVNFSAKDNIITQGDVVQVKKNDDFFLFYVGRNNNLDFRSSFFKDAPHSMYVILSEATFNEISHSIKKGFTVSCFIPYIIKDTTLRNVVGLIDGKDKNAAPLILSAHFDHLGTDLNGTVYPGSFDNASGVAFLIELSHYIKTLGKPDKPILLVGFNAEEFGLLGSKAFVNSNIKNITSAKALNFDMVGSPQDIPLTIMAGKKDSPSSPLVKDASLICTKNKIDYNYMFEDTSDHGSFREKNIDAVTLCDADMSKIHTPLDKPNIIEKKSVKRYFSVCSKEILNYSYSKNLLVLYSEYIASATLALMIFLACIFHHLKNPHE